MTHVVFNHWGTLVFRSIVNPKFFRPSNKILDLVINALLGACFEILANVFTRLSVFYSPIKGECFQNLWKYQPKYLII